MLTFVTCLVFSSLGIIITHGGFFSIQSYCMVKWTFFSSGKEGFATIYK